MNRRALVICFATALALAIPGPAAAQATRLLGTVGPGFTISLTDAAGGPVSQLQPGTYEIVVDDRSAIHNFHLSGLAAGSPDQSTAVEFVGTVTWTVTLAAGSYQYVCDPHSTAMRGAFTVGGGSPPPPPPPAAAPKRLTATVGPGFTIALRSAAGALVRSLTAGTYAVVVRDRSRIHDVHLVGPGVNRRTGVGFTGTQTWRVRFSKGSYRLFCDPHAKSMSMRFRVT